MKTYLTLVASVLGVFILSSCSSNCVTCTIENNALSDVEICEESGITYTDMDGNEVAEDEIQEYLESIGFSCN